jgi:hypothetical protein
MSEMRRLYENIKKLGEDNILIEFQVFAEENDIESIAELNDIIEEELSCGDAEI